MAVTCGAEAVAADASDSKGRIGIWPFPSIGDGLIVLGLAHSLSLSGYRATVFSDALASISPFLPCDVRPRSALDEPAGSAEPAFDALFVQRLLDGVPAAYADRSLLYDYSRKALARAGGLEHEVAPDVPFAHANGITVTELERTATLAVGWQRVAERVLGLPRTALGPGWRLGPEVVPRRHARRIVMHPEAGSVAKVWAPERSLELAARLRREGWEPVLLLDGRERERWRERYDLDVPVTDFSSFAEVVRFVAESGYFIGNDSGPGHLASSLGLPTVTILRTRKLVFNWQPGYCDNELVRGAGWPLRWWVKGLSPNVDRVHAAFRRLVERDGRNGAPIAAAA